jgi:hypothetical protein
VRHHYELGKSVKMRAEGKLLLTLTLTPTPTLTLTLALALALALTLTLTLTLTLARQAARHLSRGGLLQHAQRARGGHP